MTIAALSWAMDRLEGGERVAIASVVEAQGSVPGKPGARLVISSSGSRFGTVGGAGLEMKVANMLEGMLGSGGVSQRKRGGKVEVFLLHKDGKGKEEAQNQVIESMTSRFSNWVGFDTMDEKFGDVYTKLTAS